MLGIQGYTVKGIISQNLRFTTYKAKRNTDHKNVILKVSRFEQPSLHELAALKHEYLILKQLNLPNVIQVYDLIRHQQQLVLVLEDMGGLTLRQYLAGNPKLSLEDFFKVTIQLVDALAGLHLQHIIHKNINPSSIIINPVNLTIKLTDFYTSSMLSEEMPDLVQVQQLQGSLGYIAPEQTGRMNCPLDYRCDFYSLGVVCYELLLGRLPFDSKDPLEIIYKHLAIKPEIDESIPEPIAAIISKLLAKIPEERYSSTAGS